MSLAWPLSVGILVDVPSTLHLSDRVKWSSSPTPLWRRLTRSIPAILGFAVDLLTPGSGGGGSGGAWPSDPEMGTDTDTVLGTVTLTGRGGGMPAAFPSDQMVTIYEDRATIAPGITEVKLPLSSMTVVSARRVGIPWTRRKAVDVHWSIKVVGDQVDLTFRGRWILLAHLGTLGGWPEPT